MSKSTGLCVALQIETDWHIFSVRDFLSQVSREALVWIRTIRYFSMFSCLAASYFDISIATIGRKWL